jgi:predicted PurR-regulated permease PerM
VLRKERFDDQQLIACWRRSHPGDRLLIRALSVGQELETGTPIYFVKSTNTNVSVLFLVALLVGALVVGFWLFRPFLQPFAFATVLGIGFYPLHITIRRIVRGPNWSALLTTLIVLLIIVLPALLIASSASSELIKAARYLGTHEGGAVNYLTHKQQGAVRWLGKYVDMEELHPENALANFPGQVSNFLLATSTGLVAGLAGFAGKAILTFLILFFAFRDGNTAIENITAMLPLTLEQASRLLSGIRDSVVANLYGILAVGFAQGLLTGAALAVLHVSSALLLGLTAAVCSLIPIVGTTLVWLPAAIYLMATGHVWKGIILILWGALVVGTIDSIIRPLVVGRKVQLHPLLLLFALLGGLQVFGFIGIFIGPVVISVIAALIDILREELAASSKGTLSSTASV